jgi:hypothetical protein
LHPCSVLSYSKNEDVYHQKTNNWGPGVPKKKTGVQVSLEKREPESPRPIRVLVLSLCLVRWETTIASAQISQR